MYELYAKIIAESELLQPALNEIHMYCFQHWSRGCGTCGTGSNAPAGRYHHVPPNTWNVFTNNITFIIVKTLFSCMYMYSLVCACIGLDYFPEFASKGAQKG